jgi:L-malate glycosyltransferase
MAVVHQFLPQLDRGDAASNHALQVQRLLRDLGHDSELFVERTNVPGEGRVVGEYRSGAVLYQFAIGSVLVDVLERERPRLALNSHNLTPTRFFEVWDPPLVHGTAWGKAQLPALVRMCDLAVAVSRYNEHDLREAGFRRTAVAPILFDTATLEREVDEPYLRRLQDRKATEGGADWLFVGRVVPNKAQHDIVKAFAVYRRTMDPAARLWLVGGASSGRYEQALRRFVHRLGLDDAVTLTGPVPQGQLVAHERAADVFVCLSDHEGFCVPLLEAMHAGLPIVAFGSSAIPETLGGAGILLPDKAPALVATAVHRAVSDDAVRHAMVQAGRRRLVELSLDHARRAMTEALQPWIDTL